MIVTSIDFETANHSDVSICAAGLAVFEDGVLIESNHWLVRPPKGHGWFLEEFIGCHGIRHSNVLRESEFSSIAPEIVARLTRADLVIAHNAQFDMRKLKGSLRHFGLNCPAFKYLCTLAASRKVWPDLSSHRLSALASYIGHQFSHHNARDDAEAAGRVLYAMINSLKAADAKDLPPSISGALRSFSMEGESYC